MDLDTTLKDFPLSSESIDRIFNEVCAIFVDDDIAFSVLRITDIREGDSYPGLRVHLTASYPPLSVPLMVDVTTGDRITPREIEYSLRLMFVDRRISVLAYNLETLLAEKLETVLSRNIANTRPRDFYDIHILYALRGSECDLLILRQALGETAERRGSRIALAQYQETIASIQESRQMRGFWERYQKDFEYAKDILFDDTCNSILLLLRKTMEF